MTYTSEFPIINVTVDLVLADLAREEFVVIRRANDPFKDCWALPGGFVDPGETTAQAAVREATEEIGYTPEGIRLLGVYSEPNRDPRNRTISIAYYGLVDFAEILLTAGDDAAEFASVGFDSHIVSALAFDHAQIARDFIALVRRLPE